MKWQDSDMPPRDLDAPGDGWMDGLYSGRYSDFLVAGGILFSRHRMSGSASVGSLALRMNLKRYVLRVDNRRKDRFRWEEL